MALAPNPIEIKQQLVTLFQPDLPKTLIIPEWILTRDDNGKINVEVLRSDLDPLPETYQGREEKRVNALMISAAAFIQSGSVDDKTRRDSRSLGHNLITRHFRLWYFYQDPTGLTGEDKFIENCEIMRTKLNENPVLGFAKLDGMIAGPGAWIDGHDKLQGLLMIPEYMGDHLIFVFEGRLSVRVKEALG